MYLRASSNTMLAILILIFVIYGISCQNRNIVTSVNTRRNRTWTAKQNRFTSLPKVHIRKLMGVHENFTYHKLPPQNRSTLVRATLIPNTFDARQKWTRCRTIGTIRDQGACGSCWAFATVSSMSDRLCIKSNAKISVNISAEHLLSCCTTCGEGCNGGFPKEAWKFWISNGIVTGGDFNSRVGCQTYTSDPYNSGITPSCSSRCRPSTSIVFRRDFRFGLTAYSVAATITGIQLEILLNGPVCAVMCVYEDFLYYENGVYLYLSGEFLGYHAVKIIGWGIENGIRYWLVVNSWGVQWGIKGLFKIAQNNSKHCMEDDVTAGIPKY